MKTEGIVLREHRYGDTSKIVKIYSEKFGSISSLIKGAYNPKSRVIANTQIFSLNSYHFKKGKNFYFIQEADLIDSYYPLRENIEKMSIGYYLLELVDKTLPDEQSNPTIFSLLKKGLKVLESLDNNYLEFMLGYEMKYVSFLGYRPFLKSCVSCNSKLEFTSKFSLNMGGLLCERCYDMDFHAKSITLNMRKILLQALYLPLEKLQCIEANKEELLYLHELMVKYILVNTDRVKFNSLEMLKAFK